MGEAWDVSFFQKNFDRINGDGFTIREVTVYEVGEGEVKPQMSCLSSFPFESIANLHLQSEKTLLPRIPTAGGPSLILEPRETIMNILQGEEHSAWK